jgi:type VI secretion system secreted protein Hcp
MAQRWFLKIDGVPGDSKDAGHKGEIEVLAWSWGLARAGSPSPGGGGGAGKTSFDDFEFVSNVGTASPALVLAAAKGTHIKSAVLSGVRGSGKANGAAYLTYTLSDVIVTRVEHGEADGEVPVEEFALGYGKVAMAYSPVSASGKLGPPVTAGWDLKANKPL